LEAAAKREMIQSGKGVHFTGFTKKGDWSLHDYQYG
jgi:hypothetical protein